MEFIQSKNKQIGSLLKRAQAIEERLLYIYASSRPDAIRSISTGISNIKNALSELDSVDESIPPMKLGELIGICDNSFAVMAHQLPLFNIAEETGASNTYITDTIKDINSFERQQYLYKTDPISSQIYKWTMDKLIIMPPEQIEEEYNKHVNATSMFGAYIQHMLDTTPDENHQQFLDMLERAKTTSLLLGKNITPVPPNKITMPLQRFGIIPVRQYLTINELHKIYFGQGCASASCELDDFISIAAVNDLNVLVVSNVSSYPIEYNVSKLITEEDAKGFVMDPMIGINTTLLERFNTIKDIGNKFDNLGYMATPYKNKSNGRWIMIRTINGTHWDVMSNQKTAETPHSHAYSLKKLLLPESLITRILRGPSPRVAVYQEQKNIAIMGQLKRVKDVDQEVKRDNKPLIDTLIHRITNRIITYIDKSLLPLPTDPIKLEKAINDPMFVEIANVEMLKSYAECGVDTELPVDELVGSFISDVDKTIVIQFARHIKMNMIEKGPKPRMFKEYKETALLTRLYNIFVDIIKKSVTATIRSKENIYEKLLIKNNLLKVLD